MQKIIWLLILILLALGLVPFKFPRYVGNISDKELLVEHHESTCSAEFDIVGGQIDIPNELKPYFTNEVNELNIKGNSPFDVINENQGNWQLISDNQFIISGIVVGVDSIYTNPCGNYAVFQIDDWAPTKYAANFWTFSPSMLLIYFVSLIVCIFTSIIHFIVIRLRKRKL